ncbi:MAG: hypothetical protein ACXWWC_02120 [Chitinophagaceae bacterium]
MLSADKNMVAAIRSSLDIDLQESVTIDELKNILAGYINQLISNNFNKLISLLYRMDVNEANLMQLLHDNQAEDAGIIIANLIIERQLQKIKSKKENKGNNIISGDEMNENEKW